MNRQIITGVILLLSCAMLPACTWQQIVGGDSPSATTMTRHAQVRQSLDQLISAYESKNSRKFAELVSNRYTGEESILLTTLQRDFSTYHNLSIRYTVNNITLDGNGDKTYVAITFTREWTDIKTTRSRRETQNTSLVFILENGTYKLYTQSQPLLFGLN